MSNEEGRNKEHFEWYKGYAIKYHRNIDEWCVHDTKDRWLASYDTLQKAERWVDKAHCERRDSK